MKKLLLLLTLMSSFSAFAVEKELYQGSRIFWDTTTRKTVFQTGWYSRIIQLQDGRLMGVCEHSGIDYAFSSNLGNTWTSPKKLTTNPGGINEAVPDLIQLSDGTIIVAYNPRPSAPYSPDRLFGIRCKISTDNGVTWSEEIFVNDANHTFEDGCWEPSMLELPSGEVQLYFADEGPYTYSGEQQISMCRSFDKGRTWSAAEKVSFRAGHRDGMPVPILLQDQSEIVFVFEDNGWGYGDFFPTTARCSLEKNWHNYWVDANSANRAKTLDLSIAPLATGGAPYLRQLPNGETVISWQSKWNSSTGQITMLTAVGDEKARNFKSVTHPFIISGSTSVMWNSLAVLDDNTVIAVGGVDSSVEMIKGYPKKQFECPFGSPVVDGKLTSNEGYFNRACDQVRMGGEISTVTLCDYAFDLDSLYFICRISDRTQTPTGAYADGIRFFVDVAGASNTAPQSSAFQYYVKLSGDITRLAGTGHTFKQAKTDAARAAIKTSSAYYTIELAIPWTDMGLEGVPATDMLLTNLELRNGNSSGLATEMIPDARERETWTWMPLHLGEIPEDAAVKAQKASDLSITAYNGELRIASAEPLKAVALYNATGRQLASYSKPGRSLSVPMQNKGITLVKATLANGKTITKKVK